MLVLAGKREVAESFFVEPTTGEPHPLDWDQYLGIETLWNHRNYWVNMQDCAHGIQVSAVCVCVCVLAPQLWQNMTYHCCFSAL